MDKNQEWQQVFDRMSRTVDGLGKRIDTGILDTITALNAIGINTTSSCEGHMDWGNAHPWVRIGAAGVDELKKELRQALNAYQNASEDNRKALYSEYHAIELRLRQIHSQEEQKLVGYLDAFYKQHLIEYDRHLIISHILGGECLLQSQGADAQDIRDPELKAQKLKEYQQEMQAFASFLKKGFFSESDFDEAEYPVGQAADLLGMRHETLTRNILRGNLVAKKKGRDYFIQHAELERFKSTPRKVGRPKRENTIISSNFSDEL